MAIWSFTAERLEKLREAIEKKKAEHDELLAKSEKDLWCEDLDDFMMEWDKQVAIDAEIQTKIRRMGRRASKKIGAGKTRKGKDDDEYEPEKKSRAKPKAAPKAASTASSKGKLAPSTSAQRFADMFSSKSKVKKEASDVMDLSDNFSDDDFMSLSRKPVATQSSRAPSVSASQSMSQAPSQSEEPEGRSKRAAASKARTLFDADSDSDADDDEMLGDVGDMVKGIGKPADDKGRVSLHAMARQESSSSGGAAKAEVKSAKSFDFDDDDETNYDMLAKSSPQRAPVSKAAIIDSLLSDEDEAKAESVPPDEPPGLAAVKKVARPAAKPKPKAKPAPKAKAAAAKPTTLSPAAKAYAARQAVKKSVYDEDSEDDIAAPASPSPKRAAPARARPGRAAAARKPVIVDDEDSLMAEEQSESDDPFEMDDDDD